MKRLISTLMIGILSAVVGFATPLITFSTPAFQSSGTIAYAGGPSDPLVGSNILISTINAGSTNAVCTNCTLNFTTGGIIQRTPNSSGGRTWIFGGGPSTFTVTGEVHAAGITTNTVLLSGFFNTPTVEVNGPLNTTPRLRFFSGSLFDVKNATLVDYLLGAGFSTQFGTSFSGTYEQEFFDNFTSPFQIPIRSDALGQGIITNDQVVPEPGTVILFGSVSAVLALAGILRRRRQVA